MSDLPIGWIKTTLSDVASQGQYGWTSKATDKGRVKYLRTTDITSGRINWDTVPYCQDNPPSVEKYKIASGDILISRAGSVGFSVLVQDIPPTSAVFASYLIRYIPKAEVNPKFIAHFLQSPNYWRQISDASAGIALANVNAKKLADVVLPLAPLNEQKRIADKLDSLLTRVDACERRLERVPQILKRFRQSVLAAATSGRLTEGWREEHSDLPEYRSVTLREVATGFNYGTSSKSQKPGKVPVLRMGNIQDGKLDWADLVFTSDKGEIKKYELLHGDVLFNRTNSPELVGKTAVYKGEQPAIYAGYLIRVRCGEELLPDYLNYCLNSPAGRNWSWQVKSDGVSQSNINAQKLADFEIELPPIEEQAEIVRRVETLFAFADRLEARYAAGHGLVGRLTPSLLAKAFRGELVEQNPNDEPASVLLERIQEAREAEQTGPNRKSGKSKPLAK